MKKSEIKLNATYWGPRNRSSGKTPMRKVVAIKGPPSSRFISQEWVTYKVVAGLRPWGESTRTCTLKAFAHWAQREVTCV